MEGGEWAWWMKAAVNECSFRLMSDLNVSVSGGQTWDTPGMKVKNKSWSHGDSPGPESLMKTLLCFLLWYLISFVDVGFKSQRPHCYMCTETPKSMFTSSDSMLLVFLSPRVCIWIRQNVVLEALVRYWSSSGTCRIPAINLNMRSCITEDRWTETLLS